MSPDSLIKTCRICDRAAIRDLLEFGPQAIRNRFTHSREEAEYTHPLSIGVCSNCATVQLLDPPPVAELRPRFDWISYNEPESHLDDVVEKIARLPGVVNQSVIAGLTYKDDSTLARLGRLDFTRRWRADVRRDLGIEDAGAGIESIQEKLSPQWAGQLTSRHDRPRVLIVRHVLEHTQDTPAALEWAQSVVEPGGFVVFEVPDATRAFERFDYTTIWEEHVLYFTPATLRGCLEEAGLKVVSLESYQYALENSLVAIVTAGQENTDQPITDTELERATRFMGEFSQARVRIEERLHAAGRVAMLGAGHLAGAFINLYGVADRIEFVADDNPVKQGLYMPGSRLPILPTTELVHNRIDLCLMTVRQEIEHAVARRYDVLRSRGEALASIFPDSPFAFSDLQRAKP